MVKTRSQNRENYAKCVEWEKAEKERQKRIRKEIAERKQKQKQKQEQKQKQKQVAEKVTYNPKRLGWVEYQLEIKQNMMKMIDAQYE